MPGDIRRGEISRAPTARVPQSPSQKQKKIKPQKRPKPIRIQKGRENEPLKIRRRRERRRNLFIGFILLIIAAIAILGSFWWQGVRIQAVQTSGIDTDGMQAIVTTVLHGTYRYVIPRDSIFFFPKEEIRADILKQYPDIAAVTISRTSLSTISISSIPREAALTWCGTTYPGTVAPTISISSTTSPTVPSDNMDPSCFSADAEGVIFAALSPDQAASPGNLRIYDPLADGAASTTDPLGSVMAEAQQIPNALQLIKAIKSLGVPIVAFVIRGDEADLYAQSGTRITYVLGHEEVTAQVAESAFPSLNLDDGSLEYVDLRFEGKAYFKKVGADSASAATSSSGM